MPKRWASSSILLTQTRIIREVAFFSAVIERVFVAAWPARPGRSVPEGIAMRLRVEDSKLDEPAA